MKRLLPQPILLLPLLLLVCGGCTKVVNLSLPNAGQQIVIEGNVTDAPGPYQVAITTTVPFSADNNPPGVPGAVVTITDNTGLYDSLTEGSPGVYSTRGNWQGEPGHTYTLHVSSSGVSYTVSSTMPEAVKLDSVSFRAVTETIDGVPLNKIFVFSDRLSDGRYIRQPLADDSADLQIGDQVDLRELAQQQNTGKFATVLFAAVAPANPVTNLSGSALGYFSAHTVQTEQVFVNL
jgi:hypothetical protein